MPTQANKAILAAAAAGATSLITDLQGADSSLTFKDWVITVLAGLVAGAGVYLVPNYTRGGARRVEAGASQLATALIVIGVVLILLDLLFVQIYFGVGLGVILLIIGVVLAATEHRRV